jgi:hypothetical protein
MENNHHIQLNQEMYISCRNSVQKALAISELFRNSEHLTETIELIQSCFIDNESSEFVLVEEQNYKRSLPKLLKQIVLRRQAINYIVVGIKKSHMEISNRDIDNFEMIIRNSKDGKFFKYF